MEIPRDIWIVMKKLEEVPIIKRDNFHKAVLKYELAFKHITKSKRSQEMAELLTTKIDDLYFQRVDKLLDEVVVQDQQATVEEEGSTPRNDATKNFTWPQLIDEVRKIYRVERPQADDVIVELVNHFRTCKSIEDVQKAREILSTLDRWKSPSDVGYLGSGRFESDIIKSLIKAAHHDIQRKLWKKFVDEEGKIKADATVEDVWSESEAIIEAKNRFTK
jgi:hypothetical protein